MKKLLTLFGITTIVVVAYSCKKTPETPKGTVYLDLPATPYEYSNKTSNNQKATLGRVLFYDSHLSVNNSISCASCHKQALGFADNVAFSVGFEGRLTTRNSKNIANITGDKFELSTIDTTNLPLFWDGREEVLQHLVSKPITNHVEMGINDFSALPAKLQTLSYYPSLFQNAYGSTEITTDKISECVAVFLSSIRTDNSRFDQFVKELSAGTSTGGVVPVTSNVLTPLELNGYVAFTTKYNCENCHHIISSSYTTNDFKDIGLDKTYTDMGRGTVTGTKSDNGKFRVPNLHNVALTAPYMHDGRYKTLDEVIDHYSNNIKTSANLDGMLRDAKGNAMAMNITTADRQAIIAFLNTMTDYVMISDPKFSNPFKLK